MTKDLVKIDSAEYGLEESKAKEIKATFAPMLDKMEALEGEYNALIKKKMSPELCQEAHALRLKYVKVRTGTAEIHKSLKAFFLKGGRFVDGFKNAQIHASHGIEEKLLSIEKHYENLEKERVAKLQEERAAEFMKYPHVIDGISEPEPPPPNLGTMEESVWGHYIADVKRNYELRVEAEKKAEADRRAKEKKEAEERERQRLENIRLKKEAEEREKKLKAEQAEKDRIKKEAEDKLKAQQEKAEKERLIKEAEAQKKLDEERKAREKVEAELLEKRQAEEREKAAQEEARQAELNKDDAARVKDLVEDLERLKTKYQFKSAANKKMLAGVVNLLGKVLDYITQHTIEK